MNETKYRQTKEEPIEEVPGYRQDQGSKVQEGEIDDKLKSNAGAVVVGCGAITTATAAMAMTMAELEVMVMRMMMWGLLLRRREIIQSPF